MSAVLPLRPDPALLHWQLVDELLAERYGPLHELEREAIKRPHRDGASRLQVVTDAITTPAPQQRSGGASVASVHTPGPRQAGDVMAFGAEVGRVLSDGRIVGRAEPFAKVFASSRVVKRAVGLAAWGVLEDIALDARLDDRGRLVAETNVRRIAANLGLNKNTVTRHLRTLRDYGFVLQEEARDSGSGQYATCRYEQRRVGQRLRRGSASRRTRGSSAAAPGPFDSG